MKGCFGVGLAVIGIPLLSLVITPIEAGALLAPLIVVMDFIALSYWHPTRWSLQDLMYLLLGLAVGTAGGASVINLLDVHLVTLCTGGISLAFSLQGLVGGGEVKASPRSWLRGLVASSLSGFTGAVAHSGDPPLALYLLRLGLPKAIYTGTTRLYLAVGNLMKLGPWL